MRNFQNGFTLLLSVLLISIILSISLGISNIIGGQIFLSATGRQSQLAFYAADAGVECAIYWDTVHQGFSQSAFATSTPQNPPGQNTISNACAGATLRVGGWLSCTPQCTSANDKRQGVSSFTLIFSNGSCAKVTVTKREDNSNPSSPDIETFIHSDGQSEGDLNCNPTSARTFQRSIEARVFE